VRLTPRAVPLVTPEEIASLRTFVTGCFSKRRKQLKNAVTGMSETDLRSLGFDPAIRPERLAPADFVKLLRYKR
jgi:16S rRNA (adenine1518-N6/adenine1519-N6)-dimethyltransferase